MARFLRKLSIAGGMGAVLGLALAYPVLVVFSHKTPDHIDDSLPSGVWADNRIGTAIELIETELEMRGWVRARPGYHPQSHLIAMPAQQAGMTDVISRLASVRAGLAGSAGDGDQDLSLAATLLEKADAETAEYQIFAATQALRRFDGLKARSLLDELDPADVLAREIAGYKAILKQSKSSLDGLIRSGSRDLRDDLRTITYFRARGRVFAVGSLFRASLSELPNVSGFRSTFEDCLTLMEQAYDANPVLVSNPVPGSFSLGGNDLMAQSYLLDQMVIHMERLERLLARRNQGETLAIVDRS